MKQESKYFGLIELVNSGYEVNSSLQTITPSGLGTNDNRW
jgi:ribosomal protein L32E